MENKYAYGYKAAKWDIMSGIYLSQSKTVILAGEHFHQSVFDCWNKFRQ